MTVIKRLKAWFFTVTANPSKNIEGSRFLKGDKPTEEIYRNLAASIPFFNELDDRATSSQQGLTHAATDVEAKAYDEAEVATKTKTVQPHQLPEVKDSLPQSIDEIDAVNIPAFNDNIIESTIDTVTDANRTKRNIFNIALKSTFLTWLVNTITFFYSIYTALQGGTAGQILAKNSGDDLDFMWTDVISADTPLSVKTLTIAPNTAAPISIAHGLTRTNIRVVDAILHDAADSALVPRPSVTIDDTNINFPVGVSTSATQTGIITIFYETA